MKIDVCIPTWNSDNFLDRCLESVYREIEVNKLIVVDKYSTDDTLNIFNKYPNTEIIQSEGNLAVARQILIEKSNTELFLFIDADVELKSGYMNWVIKYLSDDMGAVASDVDLENLDLEDKYVLTLQRENRMKPDTRGFTYCTLIRKSALKGIKIPVDRYAYEDQFIKEFIEEKRYKWVVPKENLAIHYNDHGGFFDTLRFKINQGRVHRRFIGKITLFKSLKSVLSVVPSSLFVMWKTKDIRILPYMILIRLLTLYGYCTQGEEIYQNRKNI